MNKNIAPKRDFNYKIAELFLRNTRLTILTLVLFLIIGVFTSIAMFGRTTGFPNPPINAARLVTVYPGASSNTVLEDVTKPIEGAIKDIDGVKTYSSTSSNGFSVIAVTIEDNQNVDIVKGRLDTAVKEVRLPEGVDFPQIQSFTFGGGIFLYSIFNRENNLEQIYNTYINLKNELDQIPETAKITPLVELEKELVITVNPTQLQAYNLTIQNITTSIQSLSENIPIGQVTLDNKTQSLITSLGQNTLENLKALPIPLPSNGFIRLNEIATFEVTYGFNNDKPSYIGIKNDSEPIVLESLNLQIEAVSGTNLSEYNKKVEDIISNLNVNYINDEAEIALPDEGIVTIFETYSSGTDNENQINEVRNGLIGGKLDINNDIVANIGWILGGLQLVFLVMLALVSWRAALIAAISIPLSLAFSMIFLYFIGEELNTLVLFSLVLVIGLVVDPALVILESLQRKKDLGFKGIEAGLEAIKDVGSGIFMSMLTNIIVFVPFGLISGVIGDIFIYIPLTKIPAVIGSYLVPLIVLTWIGSKFLKRNKNKTQDEEQNLWLISKFFISLNTKILSSKPYWRTLIILISLGIPLFATSWLFGTGKIKQVEFSQGDNPAFGQFSGEFSNDLSSTDRKIATKELLNSILLNSEVQTVFANSGDLSYFIEFTDPSTRRDLKSTDIISEINDSLTQNPNISKLFDYSTSLLSVGPPSSDYQVSLSINTDDLDKIQLASVELGKVALDVCKKDNLVKIDSKCDGGAKIVEKIDDGFTGKQNKVYELLIDREKMIQNGLTFDQSPVSILINGQITQLFTIGSPFSDYGTVNINGEEIPIALDKTSKDPVNLEEILNSPIFSPVSAKPLTVRDIVTVKEVTAKSDIQRSNGVTYGQVSLRLAEKNRDQVTIAQVTQAIVNYYSENDFAKTQELGLEEGSIEEFSQSDSAEFQKSIQELFIVLLLAILLSYFVLAIFYKSLTQPFVILFTIPLTFLGVFGGLAVFTNGQFGLLETIGIIILIGVVENVAIFLIDGALKKINEEKWDDKKAISYMSGLRLKPIILSTFTAIASLIPLALFSEIYKPIAIVLIGGLISSGIFSLITTPILFIFFRWASKHFWRMNSLQKILAVILFPFFVIYWTRQDKKNIR